jgi:hypothetical protein
MSYNTIILFESEERCSLFGFWSYAVQLLLAILAILVLVGRIKFIKLNVIKRSLNDLGKYGSV